MSTPAGPSSTSDSDAGRARRPVPPIGGPVEGTIAVPVEPGADGGLAGVPTDHRHGLAGGAAHPGGVAARAGPVVLGTGGDHGGKPGATGGRRPGPGDGPGVGRVGAGAGADRPMTPGPDFPRLTPGNYRVTSPPSPDYNCIAWAAGDTGRWWEPGVYWPATTPPGDYGTGVLTLAFQARLRIMCGRGTGAGIRQGGSVLRRRVLHARRRQLPDGKWTSKLGGGEDIQHDAPEDLSGGAYGEVVQFMRRPVAASPPTA